MKKNPQKCENRKISVSAKVKLHKHKYPVTKRCSEKKTTVLETDQNFGKITE